MEVTTNQTGKIVIDILNEVARAEEKHPTWPADILHASAIVAEEAGELIRAAVKFEREGGALIEIRKEAIQVGATCIRFLLNGRVPISSEKTLINRDELMESMTPSRVQETAALFSHIFTGTDFITKSANIFSQAADVITASSINSSYLMRDRAITLLSMAIILIIQVDDNLYTGEMPKEFPPATPPNIK